MKKQLIVMSLFCAMSVFGMKDKPFAASDGLKDDMRKFKFEKHGSQVALVKDAFELDYKIEKKKADLETKLAALWGPQDEDERKLMQLIQNGKNALQYKPSEKQIDIDAAYVKAEEIDEVMKSFVFMDESENDQKATYVGSYYTYLLSFLIKNK